MPQHGSPTRPGRSVHTIALRADNERQGSLEGFALAALAATPTLKSHARRQRPGACQEACHDQTEACLQTKVGVSKQSQPRTVADETNEPGGIPGGIPGGGGIPDGGAPEGANPAREQARTCYSRGYDAPRPANMKGATGGMPEGPPRPPNMGGGTPANHNRHKPRRSVPTCRSPQRTGKYREARRAFRVRSLGAHRAAFPWAAFQAAFRGRRQPPPWPCRQAQRADLDLQRHRGRDHLAQQHPREAEHGAAQQRVSKRTGTRTTQGTRHLGSRRRVRRERHHRLAAQEHQTERTLLLLLLARTAASWKVNERVNGPERTKNETHPSFA